MHLLIYYEDVDQLHERLISVWCELNHSVVNHAIDEWRRRLPVSFCAHVGLHRLLYRIIRIIFEMTYSLSKET